MLLRCHYIQLKLLFGLQSPEGELIGLIFFNETINAQRYQKLLESFTNQLDYVELINGYFQQDPANIHTAEINY
jgi:hypothetical protein